MFVAQKQNDLLLYDPNLLLIDIREKFAYVQQFKLQVIWSRHLAHYIIFAYFKY